MRSGITSYAILLPLLAGLAERALAAPQPASVTLIAGSKYDTTAYCSADGADGRQVFGSQDQVPNVIACAGWEGVQGDFGDSQSFHQIDSDNLVECTKSCWTTRKKFPDNECKSAAYDVGKKKCSFYNSVPQKIDIDKKFNNASSIVVMKSSCPDNKIQLEGGTDTSCCSIRLGNSIVSQGL